MTRSLKPQYFTWLIFSCFLLFPFKRSVELPLLIMAIGGGVLLYKYGRAFLQEPAVRLFTLLFACIWLPMLLSAPDSYDVKKSGSTVLVFIRFYLAGLLIIWAMRKPDQISLLFKLLAWLTAFWVIDALFQAAVGQDLFGYAQVSSRLNGIFGEDGLKLGNALPVLSPFLLLSLRAKPALMLLAAVLTGAVVVLAGSRGGWVSFGLVCIWLILSETRRRDVAFWKVGAVVGLVLFYSLLVRHWRLASQEQKIRSLPFAMGTLAWVFPFSTHPSFYTAQWSTLIWLMVALLCASLLSTHKADRAS